MKIISIILALSLSSATVLAESVYVSPDRVTVAPQHQNPSPYLEWYTVSFYVDGNLMLTESREFSAEGANLEVLKVNEVLKEAKKENRLVQIRSSIFTFYRMQDYIKVSKRSSN